MDHSGEHALNRARTHRHCHRPSPGGGSALHPDRGHAQGRDRRGRRARRAARARGRALCPPLGVAIGSGEGGGAGMNERAAPPGAPPPPPPSPPQPQPSRRTPPAATGRDREFLPAALEILETPPPPLPIALIATISACALAALIWSYFGRLDVHATAPGKVEPAGYAKVIEPLDPGKVAAIHVEKGQTVKAGDLLLELDTAEANADALSAHDALNASLAEIARRRYAIDAVRAAESEGQGAHDRLGARSAGEASAAASSPVENLAGRAE